MKDVYGKDFPNSRYYPCARNATTSTLGPKTAKATCLVERPFYGSGFHGRGRDEARLMTCHATLEIRPATLFAVVSGGGTGAGTMVSGPGSLSISALIVRGAAARLRASRARPPIAPITRKVKAAGVVRFRLKLSASAKRTYNRGRALKLRLRVAFKPAGGKTTVRTQRLTLRKRTPVPRPPKVGTRG
jgi:hypothetical protein